MSGEEVGCPATEAIEAETTNERERLTNLLRRIAQLGTDSDARHLPAPKFAYNSN